MRRWLSPGTRAGGLFAFTLAVYAVIYLLWATGHQDAYLAVVRFWGIDAWHWPFLDLDTVLSWSECHRRGFDVYVNNLCAPLGGTASYGPILTLLPLDRSHTQIAGIVQGVAFLATAALLLRPARGEEWIAGALALLSTASLFALERGNVDIVEFLLAAAAGWLAARARVAGYVLYFLGGMMKFYPFALFLKLLRERPRTAIAGSVVAATAIVLFALSIRTQLAVIGDNLPDFDYNDDTFGALVLPYGLADWLSLGSVAGGWIFAGLLIAASAAAVGLTHAMLKNRLRPAANAARWDLLTAGAIIMVGCFLLQTNINYRAIFFLLMLPGLFALAARARSRGLRRIFRLTVWAIIFCMWGEFVRRTLEKLWGDADTPPLIFFVGRELVWWGVMTVGFAIILLFVRRSPLLRALLRRRR